MRSGPRRRWVHCVLGFAAAAGGLLFAGELYLRHFPPRELQPHLGDASPLAGPFAPDPVYGARYRDWDAFAADYREPLAKYLPFGPPDAPPKGWAMFGNSFVQAPGMLADTARREMPGFPVFNLGRNEPLPVRLAQIELLLDRGLKPERVLLTLLPIDLLQFHWYALDQMLVNDKGALTYRVRDPNGIAGWWVARSRLALTAWVRTGMHHAHPRYPRRKLEAAVPEDTQADLRRLFAALHGVTQKHGVPVTVILIPSHEQVVKGSDFRWQEQLAGEFRGLGFDVCDTRGVFMDAADKDGLFIPDNHFSDRGNHLLLSAIRGHLDALPSAGRGAAP